jgi:hypothetical protein
MTNKFVLCFNEEVMFKESELEEVMRVADYEGVRVWYKSRRISGRCFELELDFKRDYDENAMVFYASGKGLDSILLDHNKKSVIIGTQSPSDLILQLLPTIYTKQQSSN